MKDQPNKEIINQFLTGKDINRKVKMLRQKIRLHAEFKTPSCGHAQHAGEELFV